MKGVNPEQTRSLSLSLSLSCCSTAGRQAANYQRSQNSLVQVSRPWTVMRACWRGGEWDDEFTFAPEDWMGRELAKVVGAVPR